MEREAREDQVEGKQTMDSIVRWYNLKHTNTHATHTDLVGKYQGSRFVENYDRERHRNGTR